MNLSSSLCSLGVGVCVTSLLLVLSLSVHSTSLSHLQWPPIYGSSFQPFSCLVSSCVPISFLVILFVLFLSLLLAKPLLTACHCSFLAMPCPSHSVSDYFPCVFFHYYPLSIPLSCLLIVYTNTRTVHINRT